MTFLRFLARDIVPKKKRLQEAAKLKKVTAMILMFNNLCTCLLIHAMAVCKINPAMGPTIYYIGGEGYLFFNFLTGSYASEGLDKI